jgi:hypothetical protein
MRRERVPTGLFRRKLVVDRDGNQKTELVSTRKLKGVIGRLRENPTRKGDQGPRLNSALVRAAKRKIADCSQNKNQESPTKQEGPKGALRKLTPAERAAAIKASCDKSNRESLRYDTRRVISDAAGVPLPNGYEDGIRGVSSYYHAASADEPFQSNREDLNVAVNRAMEGKWSAVSGKRLSRKRVSFIEFQQIINDLSQKHKTVSRLQIAKRLGVHITTLWRWGKEWQLHGQQIVWEGYGARGGAEKEETQARPINTTHRDDSSGLDRRTS